MMNSNILELEQQDIELQLQEIQLKRRMVEIEREKLEKSESTPITLSGNTGDLDIGELEEKLNGSAVSESTFDPRINCRCIPEPVYPRTLYLHYSKSAKENLMKIAGVTPEGCILVSHGNNSSNISKKYNVRSMKWIRDNLPKWSKQQKTQSHFWTNIAAKYSRKFFDNESISRTTIEKLCYLVDSGMMDKWFDEYNYLKNKGTQSQLQLEECK